MVTKEPSILRGCIYYNLLDVTTTHGDFHIKCSLTSRSFKLIYNINGNCKYREGVTASSGNAWLSLASYGVCKHFGKLSGRVHCGPGYLIRILRSSVHNLNSRSLSCQIYIKHTFKTPVLNGEHPVFKKLRSS